MLHRLALAPLAPLLLWQGARVRRLALRLPEAAGPRQGVTHAGAPPALRLLVVGDSSAAGVGVATQDEAPAAPLAAALAARLRVPVGWQLIARSGHTAADALRALQDAPALQPADLLLVVLGVNDAVAMTGSRRWLATLDALHTLAAERAGVRASWHSALPPMGRFPLLPQPLRWVLGREAARLDSALRRHLHGRPDRRWVGLPDAAGAAGAPGGPAAPASAVGDLVAAGWMAADGYHPGPRGYAAWATLLADQMAPLVTPGVAPGAGPASGLAPPAAASGAGASSPPAAPQAMQ